MFSFLSSTWRVKSKSARSKIVMRPFCRVSASRRQSKSTKDQLSDLMGVYNTSMYSICIITTGRSSVLREMLKNSLEKNEDDKIVLKLEEDADVTLETFDLFLIFIYSGRFKETRKTRKSVHFSWVDLLPQLVALAHKVGNQESLYMFVVASD